MDSAHLPARRGFVIGHSKRLMDGLRSHALVPGVDGDTRPETAEAVGAGELAQDERAVALLLALHELVRTKGHALAETCDHEGISDGEKSEILAEGEILGVQEYHWLVRKGREARVEMRDDVGDTALSFILLRRLQSNLNKHHIPVILGVLVQEGFEGLNLLTYALNSIEFVAADDKLHPRVTLFE